jgi:hypothetical protein
MLYSHIISNRDGTPPATVEPLPGEQTTARPLGTAPPDLLEMRRIRIVAAAAG